MSSTRRVLKVNIIEVLCLQLGATSLFKFITKLFGIAQGWKKVNLSWYRPLGNRFRRVGRLSRTLVPFIRRRLSFLKVYQDWSLWLINPSFWKEIILQTQTVRKIYTRGFVVASFVGKAQKNTHTLTLTKLSYVQRLAPPTTIFSPVSARESPCFSSKAS